MILQVLTSISFAVESVGCLVGEVHSVSVGCHTHHHLVPRGAQFEEQVQGVVDVQGEPRMERLLLGAGIERSEMTRVPIRIQRLNHEIPCSQSLQKQEKNLRMQWSVHVVLIGQDSGKVNGIKDGIDVVRKLNNVTNLKRGEKYVMIDTYRNICIIIWDD